jgi:hypothetical protein
VIEAGKAGRETALTDLRVHEADVDNLVLLPGVTGRDAVALFERAALDADERDHTAVTVVSDGYIRQELVRAVRTAYEESNSRAFNGSERSPTGGGIRSTMASRTFSTPRPCLSSENGTRPRNRITNRLRGDLDHILRVKPERRLHLIRHKVGLGCRHVDLPHNISRLLLRIYIRMSQTLFNTGMILSPRSFAMWKTEMD